MEYKKPKFSVIIPVYNEHKTVRTIIKKVKKVSYPGTREIIVINDGSTDKTAQVLKGISGIKKVSNIKNRGKGYSSRKGFELAQGQIILIQDADLEYDPQDHLKLIKKMEDEKIDVVYGSRFLKNNHKPRYKLFYLGNILLSYTTRLLYQQKITDMETCYKIFRKKILHRIELTQDRFDIEPEITCKLIKEGYSIVEVPIKYKSRSFKEGKKIGLKDGIRAFYLLFKYRFLDS